MPKEKFLLPTRKTDRCGVPGPPFVRNGEENGHMILGVAKASGQILQVDGLFGEGVTGLVANHDVVNPGLPGQSTSVGGSKGCVPSVDGGEPMLGEEVAKLPGIRMPWTSLPSLLLKVMESHTVWNVGKAGVEVTSQDDHVPLGKTSKQLITGMKEFPSMLKTKRIMLNLRVLINVEKVNPRGG